MITPPILQPTTFFDQKMVNETAILAAIADLKTQAKLNYDATAKKHNVDRNTLRRRFKGETTSVAEAHSENLKLLSNAEERALVDRVNTLSARGIPPTPRMLTNIVQELTNGPVGDHWVSRFVKRYKNELCSFYLDSIDHAKRVADNSRHFEHYFMLVSFLFTL